MNGWFSLASHALLDIRDLYEILNVTDRMFNDNALWQIHQRKQHQNGVYTE